MDCLIRPAKFEDLSALITLFVDDKLGGHTDSLDAIHGPQYEAVMQELLTTPSICLFVAESEGEVIGMAQLAILLGLSDIGARRARISGVQVSDNYRSKGIGKKLIEACISETKKRGVENIFLASNKKRIRAHDFYNRLGFKQSHEGFSLKI